MPPTTASSSTSIVAGVPPSTRNDYSKRRSRSTAPKGKPPGGWPRPTGLLTCRGTRSTSGTPMPRRGCPSTAPSTGCARSTATNPGTTNCVPKPAITAALPCTPTPPRTRGCGSDRHASGSPRVATSPGGDQPGTGIEDHAALVGVVRRQHRAQALDGAGRLILAEAREGRAGALEPLDERERAVYVGSVEDRLVDVLEAHVVEAGALE